MCHLSEGCVRPSDLASEGAGIVGLAQPIYANRSAKECPFTVKASL